MSDEKRLADESPADIAAAAAAGVAAEREPVAVTTEFLTAWQAGTLTAQQALDGIFANFKTGVTPTPGAKVRQPDVADVHFWTALAQLGAALALETHGDVIKIGFTIAELVADLLELLAAP